MPVDLDPRAQFRVHMSDYYAKFATMIAEPAMRLGMNTALTQLCQSGVTTEELNGAKKYMKILSSLTDNDPPKRLPQKTLKNS